MQNGGIPEQSNDRRGSWQKEDDLLLQFEQQMEPDNTSDDPSADQWGRHALRSRISMQIGVG
jgi:hypothetical protein